MYNQKYSRQDEKLRPHQLNAQLGLCLCLWGWVVFGWKVMSLSWHEWDKHVEFRLVLYLFPTYEDGLLIDGYFLLYTYTEYEDKKSYEDLRLVNFISFIFLPALKIDSISPKIKKGIVLGWQTALYLIMDSVHVHLSLWVSKILKTS